MWQKACLALLRQALGCSSPAQSPPPPSLQGSRCLPVGLPLRLNQGSVLLGLVELADPPRRSPRQSQCLFSCTQELESCPASLGEMLTLPEATAAVLRRAVAFDQGSRDVPPTHNHFPWPPRCAGDNLQRFLAPALALALPPHRACKHCSSLQANDLFISSVGLSQPYRSAPAVVSFVRSAVLGSLYQIASPNIDLPAVYSRPLSLEYPVLPSDLTA